MLPVLITGDQAGAHAPDCPWSCCGSWSRVIRRGAPLTGVGFRLSQESPCRIQPPQSLGEGAL